MIRDQKIYSFRRLRNLITKENGWFGKEDFALLIRREKELSLRNGRSLVLVVIEIADALPSLIGEEEVSAFLTEVAAQVVANTRVSDLKCLLDSQEILILLSDTNMDGCQQFITKMVENMLAHFRKHPKYRQQVWLEHISIAAYPPAAFQEELDTDSWTPLCKYAPLQKAPVAAKTKTRQEYTIPVRQDFATTNGEPSSRELSVETIPGSLPPFDLQALSGPYAAESAAPGSYAFLKRVMDIIGAVTGLLLFAPVFILVALAIKLSSPGPVFFRQERIGFRGKPFQMMKFRTMRSDCGNSIHKEYVQKLIQGEAVDELNNGTAEQPQFKLRNDPRITPVGHILRRTSLDEIPQFINVLKGEMSIVGPRPPLDYEVEVYQNWHLRRLMEAKPGITGLWQAYSRNRASFDEMVRMDLQYVKKRSLWLDLKIIFRTFAVVFRPTGS